MKTHKSILSATGLIGAILATCVSTAFSQTSALESPPIGTPNPAANSNAEAAAIKLAAPLVSVGEGVQVKGTLMFAKVGYAVSVSGRIEGLEPLKPYQLTLQASLEASSPQAGWEAPHSATAGAPASGPPVAGAPTAGTPEAGKPDGTSPPGAPGSGSSGTGVSGTKIAKTIHAPVPESSGNLGVITADSKGAANVNATIRNADLNEGSNGILGRDVFLTIKSEDGSPAGHLLVATGKIGVAKLESQSASAGSEEKR